MKVLFISVTLAVVYLIRYKRIIRVTYDKDRDTFRSELLIAVSTVCALLVHERIKGAGYLHFFMEVRPAGITNATVSLSSMVAGMFVSLRTCFFAFIQLRIRIHPFGAHRNSSHATLNSPQRHDMLKHADSMASVHLFRGPSNPAAAHAVDENREH